MSSREVEEIKSKIDVAELVGEYLKLTPAGTGVYRALCPFHNEKTPSFMVSPARGSWHCFGCSTGGDIFEFLMKIENIDFPEALKILAQKAGVTLSRGRPELTSQKNRLYDLCELTAKYWQKVLQESPRAQIAREYVGGRGLSEDSVADFRLGFAVDDWSNLYDFLRKRGYTDNEIFLAGLSIKKDRGSGFYDRFRYRLMFPILDAHGRVVGFGGRALKKDEPAKYINSPQTLIYNKSEVLYGLNWAKDAIRKADLCILVEGYMDVIPSHQAGVKNTVSISGTALTQEQLRALKRYTSNLALALDMDDAGQRAAERSIELALENEMNVKVISLPHGKDPGECAIKDPSAWREAIVAAESVMEYYFRRATRGRNLAQPEDKKLVAKYLAEKIVKMGNPVERDHWLKELSNRLNVAEDSVRELARRLKPSIGQAPKALQRPQIATSQAAAPNTATDRNLLMFVRILALIWMYPEFLAKLGDNLEADVWTSPVAADLYKKIILYYTVNNELFSISAAEREEQPIFDLFYDWVKTQAVSEPALKTLEQSFLLAQKDFADVDVREAKNELDTLIRLLKSNYISVMISRLKLKLEEAERTGDTASAESFYLELSELIKKKSAV